MSNIDVAKEVAKLYATKKGREFLRGGRSHMAAIVICKGSDLVSEVLRRVMSHETDGALVAFSQSGELRFINIRPALGGEDASLSSQLVGQETQIGMLYDAAAATGEKRFHLGSVWNRDSVASVPQGTLIAA